MAYYSIRHEGKVYRPKKAENLFGGGYYTIYPYIHKYRGLQFDRKEYILQEQEYGAVIKHGFSSSTPGTRYKRKTSTTAAPRSKWRPRRRRRYGW